MLSLYSDNKEILKSDKVYTKFLLIHLIGGNSSGKSGVTGALIQKYPEIVALGKYKESNTTKGVYTGGLDAMKMTTEERFDLIKKKFASNIPVIIVEGMMTIYYESFFKKYYELQKIKDRDILVVHLKCSLDECIKRVTIRGKKSMDQKRLDHLKLRITTCINLYKKIQENDRYKKIEFDSSDKSNFANIISELSKIVDKYV